MAYTIKNPPAMWETQVRSLGWEDLLEGGTATHSSILAWRILWTEEPSGLQSPGLQRVGHDWACTRGLRWTFEKWAISVLFLFRLNSDNKVFERIILAFIFFFLFSFFFFYFLAAWGIWGLSPLVLCPPHPSNGSSGVLNTKPLGGSLKGFFKMSSVVKSWLNWKLLLGTW